MRKQLIQQLIEKYKKSLNQKSKWYSEDVKQYKKAISELSVDELNRKLGNISALVDNDSKFNRAVRKEITKLDNAGMYNISGMKPGNALD